jgi:quinol monooxygenase YgiN
MSKEENIAIMGFSTAKTGREKECIELAKNLTRSTHSEDKGCLNYIFFQRIDNPREFIFLEQWQDVSAVQAHIKRLISIYGPPSSGQGLPDALTEPWEKSEFVSLQLIA